MSGDTPPKHLTPALLEVLTLVAHGYRYGEIAVIRERSVKTVQTQAALAIGVLHAKNITHAIAIALVTGKIKLEVVP